jgi:hypothetical protein
VGGDSLKFLAGGGFAGAGELNTVVRADSGSLIVATGDLAIGLIGRATPLTLEGRIETGAGVFTLRSGRDPRLDGELTLGGGDVNLEGGGSLGVLAGATVTGRGNINAFMAISGTVSPGSSAGRLAVTGATTVWVVVLQPTAGVDLGPGAPAGTRPPGRRAQRQRAGPGAPSLRAVAQGGRRRDVLRARAHR